MTASCFKNQKAVHLPWQLKDVMATALAAKARVVRFEDGGRLEVHRRAARLAALTSQGVDHTLGREGWLQRWRSRCFLLQLAEADRQVRVKLAQLPPDTKLLAEQAG